MNPKSAFLLFILFLFTLNGCSGQQEKELTNPFFIFNNGLNKSGLDFIPYEQQALMLDKFGFDGIEHREVAGILELKEALEERDLRIFASYIRMDIDREEPFIEGLREIIPHLAGTGIILWIHIHSEKFKPSDEAADELIVPLLQELADFVSPYGIKVAVYPHVNFIAERPEDSFRIARKADRENIGAVFNLPHFLRTDSSENLTDIINLIMPRLFAVSICGADDGDTRNMGWDQLIQPLGQGTFDTYSLVEYLADNGYKGPIGLQCWALPGHPDTYMKQSGDTWQLFKRRYSDRFK